MTDWLSQARLAYISSTSFVDTNYRRQWEDNLRAFQSRHHSASKYLTNAYRYKSKVFRPKPRSAVRNNEAAAAAAFFTNNDVVSITARDPGDKVQRASAELMQALVQYRLTHTIPWFVTLIGGFQDAEVIGVVASIQSWKYKAIEEETLVPTDIPGTSFKEKVTVVQQDQPDVELIPVENLRFHPSADWRDPIGSSPYVIRLIPMYLMDVKARMEDDNEKTGKGKWIALTDDQLNSGTRNSFDSTRLTRAEGREDEKENPASKAISDYDIVWVHENFMRDSNGSDKIFYTLGTEQLLSEPVPVKEVYFTGKRPIAMGCAVIETHKIMPASPLQLGQNVAREINEVTNSRLDNVKLILNKRYLVKRGVQVDLRSIVRNVAGSVTFVNDVETDVKAFEFKDVTGSSYEEQNRLATEYDELVGNFSQSSVANNRKLNETVGGMQMLRAGAYGLTEYLIRTFAETWVKEVLWQLVKLEQKYETDVVLLAIAGSEAKLLQKYGIDEVTDELLNQELTLEVNVGIGATDPITKLNQFLLAMKHLTEILRDPPPNMNLEEVQKEIFGHLGHKDGSRFMLKEDDMSDTERQLMQAIKQQQQIIDQLKQALDDKNVEFQTKIATTQMKEEGDTKRATQKAETDITKELIKLENPVPGENKRG